MRATHIPNHLTSGNGNNSVRFPFVVKKSIVTTIFVVFSFCCIFLVIGADYSDADPSPIDISTVEEFNSITDFGATYNLTTDLDFNNTDSSLKDSNFSGNFIGNGHKISNVTSQLFGTVSGEVSHLTIEGNIRAVNTGLLCERLTGTSSQITLRGNVESYGSGNVGGLCSVVNGNVQNVTNYATVVGTYDLGGIAGKMTGGTIIHGINHASITSSTHRAGGLIGLMTGGSITNSENDGDITGRLDGGGIAGSCEGGTVDGYVHDCIVTGGSGSTGGLCGYIGNMWTINSQKEFVKNTTIIGEVRIGGFVGFCDDGSTLENVKVTSCTVKTTNSRMDSADIGGIVGKTDVSVIKCIANADIIVTNNGVCTGGIVGFGYRVSFSDLTFNGTVTSNADYVGGIVGAVDIDGFVGLSSPSYSISGCTANATVKGESCVGGILGMMKPLNNSLVKWYYTIETCETTGSVDAKYHVGGIVGKGLDTIVKDSTNNMDIKGRNQVGGIVGGCAKADYCINNGNVTATGSEGIDTNCGGIGGYTHFSSSNCINNGEVTSLGGSCLNTGGGFGWTGSDCTKITNNGVVRSDGIRVGGIVGCFNGGYMTDCKNTASVTGGDYVGGIIGLRTSDCIISYCENTGIVTAMDGDSNDLYNDQRPDPVDYTWWIVAGIVALIIAGFVIYTRING